MKTRRFAPFVLTTVILATWSAAHASSVLYLAPDSPNNFSNNEIGFSSCCGFEPGGSISGAFSVGNTISLDTWGTVDLTVDLFGYAGGSPNPGLPIEVSIYSGSNPNTGTLIGSEQVTPTGNGWTTEVLNFGDVTLPSTVTYIVSIVGNNGSYDDGFVNWQQFTGVTGSPTVGTSGDMWYGTSGPGSYVADNTYAVATGAETNTLAAEFLGSPTIPYAVLTPEPSSILLLGTGVMGLALVAFRKFRSARQAGLPLRAL